jgi:hypothetical protein
MLIKSEILLLAVVVPGTMASAPATRHPSFMSRIGGEPSIACCVPPGAFRGLSTFAGEKKVLSDQELVFHRST